MEIDEIKVGTKIVDICGFERTICIPDGEESHITEWFGQEAFFVKTEGDLGERILLFKEIAKIVG